MYNLKHGLELIALAVLKEKKSHTFNEETILKAFKKELADYKQIRGGIYFLDEFPLTPSAKIKRNEVKKIVTEKLKRTNNF